MPGWQYLHVNASTTPNYRAVIQGKLNEVRPRADGVIGFLWAGDFHFWMREDGNGPTYTLTNMNPTYMGAGWTREVVEMLQRKRMMFVGMNRSNPPDLWYLEYYDRPRPRT